MSAIMQISIFWAIVFANILILIVLFDSTRKHKVIGGYVGSLTD